tara:strand:- start:659 stop:868 length:210 start_codon:yes stop_codon:yes gene_type:complete
MFEVFVLVCLVSNPNTCFEVADTRGPYETKEQCIARSEEMREAINEMPDHIPQAYKCLHHEIKVPGVST